MTSGKNIWKAPRKCAIEVSREMFLSWQGASKRLYLPFAGNPYGFLQNVGMEEFLKILGSILVNIACKFI